MVDKTELLDAVTTCLGEKGSLLLSLGGTGWTAGVQMIFKGTHYAFKIEFVFIPRSCTLQLRPLLRFLSAS